MEAENLVLNKDIGVRTDEFSYVVEPSPTQNRPFDESFFYNDSDKVRFYTGLHSFQVLMKTFHFIEPHVKALFALEQVPRIYHGADEAETQYSSP